MKNTNIQTISLQLFKITIHLFITCLFEFPVQVKQEESHFKQSLLLLLLSFAWEQSEMHIFLSDENDKPS